MNELKPYNNYKETDLLWLDKLPSHWIVRRAKSMFTIIDIRSETGNEELLSVSSNYGVVKRKNVNVTMFKAESYKGYKLCWKKDLAVNSLWAWQQGLGFSEYYGIISTAYSVYRLQNEIFYNYKYYNYLLRSSDYLWELRVRSKGIWRSRYQLHDQSFMDIPMIVPSRDEQDQIVKYLDSKLAMISKFIKAKKKMITLLKEQKQAIINQAVTRGLNPNVKMKPSGIEWIGEIPEHWKVTSLKRLFASITYGISESSTDEGTIPVITMGNINDGEITVPTFGGVNTVDKGLLLKKNDLLFNRTNSIDLVGKTGIYRSESDKAVTFASYLVRLRVKESYSSEYVNFLLNSSSFISFARSQAYKSINQANLNPTRYGYIMIAYPGQLEEQHEILYYIKNKVDIINRSILKFKQEIDLITEYCTRLISDVVTGKVDVRNIAIDEATIDDSDEGVLEDEIEDNEDSLDGGEGDE